MKPISWTILLLLGGLAPFASGVDSSEKPLAQLSDRPWPGPEIYANRIQDWRVKDGRLECLTAAKGAGFRTAHLLTSRAPSDGDTTFGLRVVVFPPDSKANDLTEESLAGFLVGAGDRQTDYRLTALIQQAPAAGGGNLAVVDSRGQVKILDFTNPADDTGHWTIRGGVKSADLPVLASGDIPSRAPVGPIVLELTLTPDGTNTGTISLRASDGQGALSQLVWENAPREHVAGGLALVSHRGSETGYAFADLEVSGAESHPDHKFGPILGVLYTVNREKDGTHTLRLTAQMPVLGEGDARTATLELEEDDRNFREVATATLVEDSFTFPFQMEDVPTDRDRTFRVIYELAQANQKPERFVYEGTLQRVPGFDEKIIMANLSCVKNYTGGLRWDHQGLWFPHSDLVERVTHHDPDFLYFAGDQIYEGDISSPDRSTPERALLDYHTKYQRFLWAFGNLTRKAPAVAVPDDHDVFHGNLWGAGGIKATGREGLSAQDAGGYKLDARVVNAIHRTLTSNLPESVIPGPIGQGIYPFTTRLLYGGLDLVILSDRMWKDSATVMVPEGNVINGFFKNGDFDPRDANVAGASLLGEAQEVFLDEWGEDPVDGSWMKVVLSQSPFSCVHTLPHPARTDAVVPRLTVPRPGEYPENDAPVVDTDSNGWPQAARNRAVRLLKKARALHLAGDQHLSTVIRYGIDEFRDGTLAFTSPAMANTWPRRWMPKEAGGGRTEGQPRYTGDFLDGFGNKVTVLAASNPSATGREPAALYDRSPGYGIVRFLPEEGTYVLEAWPRYADPSRPEEMFPGWPIRALMSE